MKQLFTVAALAGVLVGCVAPTPPLVASTAFNPADVDWAKGKGNNTISGNALLRTAGGEARTCAALEVHLSPDSPYTRERVQGLYGNLDHGMNNIQAPKRFAVDPPGYDAAQRITRCDAQGNFEFKNLPDGTYYVQAMVVWQIPSGNVYIPPVAQGGVLMSKVQVAGGETSRVVVTQ